jgi:arylsulfatase A-like enzyme
VNVVLWVVDSLRRDRLGAYGCSRGSTPHLDALAADGVVFERAYSQATWTKPSAGSLLTGLYPALHGARCFEHRLHGSVPRLPELLKRSGLATAVFTAIAHVNAASGFDRGTDRFVELWERKPYVTGERPVKWITAADVRQEAQEWIARRSRAGSPFFALLWTIDTHVPFESERVLRRFPGTLTADGKFSIESLPGIKAAATERHLDALLTAYEAAVSDTDEEIGCLVRFLEEQGVYEDTLFVVLADHGEVFNEHSRGEHSILQGSLGWLARLPGASSVARRYRVTNRYGWLGHLNLLPYDLVLRVPLVMRFPGGQWKGHRVPRVVQLIDLAPTILELLGDEEGCEGMQGRSILSQLRGQDGDTTRYSFSDSQTHVDRLRYVSVQEGDWKLIRAIEPEPSSSGRGLRGLFDPTAWHRRLSPGEVLVHVTDEGLDRKRQEPTVYSHLRMVLDDWLEDNRRRPRDSALLAGDEQRMLEHLAELGYV